MINQEQIEKNWNELMSIIDDHFDDLINDLTETSNLEDLY